MEESQDISGYYYEFLFIKTNIERNLFINIYSDNFYFYFVVIFPLAYLIVQMKNFLKNYFK